MTTTGSLRGRVALVTGSTSGIGLGIARALAAEGADIVFNGIDDDATGTALSRDTAARFGVRALYHDANMAQPTQIADMVRFTQDKLGALDILVNNAGIQHVAPIEDFPATKWDAILAINLSSNFHAMKAALPAMKARNWGRIINIASTHALVGSPEKSAYVAAKHGVLGLTKVAALETARTGITVNAICPGWVLTPLVQQQIDDNARARGTTIDDEKQALLRAKQPSGEFVTPEQVAALVIFLCGDAAAQIRGAAFNVDGGWVAQ